MVITIDFFLHEHVELRCMEDLALRRLPRYLILAVAGYGQVRSCFGLARSLYLHRSLPTVRIPLLSYRVSCISSSSSPRMHAYFDVVGSASLALLLASFGSARGTGGYCCLFLMELVFLEFIDTGLFYFFGDLLLYIYSALVCGSFHMFLALVTYFIQLLRLILCGHVFPSDV